MSKQVATTECSIHPGQPAETTCKTCGRGLCSACARQRDSLGRCTSCQGRSAVAHGRSQPVPAHVCAFHPTVPAQMRCARCQRLLCMGCARPAGRRFACPECAEKLLKQRPQRRLSPALPAALLGVLGLGALLLITLPRTPPTAITSTAVSTPAAPVTPVSVSPSPPTVSPPSPTAPAPSLEQAAELVKAVTVLVSTEKGQGSGISLGNGNVLTAYHVVQGARQIRVRFANGAEYWEDVRVGETDTRRDLARIRTLATGQSSARFGDSRSLRPAEPLIAVGYPISTVIGAQQSSVTRGVYSARWLAPNGVSYVQTDTSISRGNSGGPVADGQGHVIGVVVFGFSGTGVSGINYAIAEDEVQAFLRSLPQ